MRAVAQPRNPRQRAAHAHWPPPGFRRGLWRGQKRPTCRYNPDSSILTAKRGKTVQKSALFPIVAKAFLCYNYRWSGSFQAGDFLFPQHPL